MKPSGKVERERERERTNKITSTQNAIPWLKVQCCLNQQVKRNFTLLQYFK